ncbi:helicase HerA-like domain-containing protein [Rhodobacter lacus]|uniref:Helicase HerA-like domain-containing protein n=1 Tax=Rhodobacter lacus TaxID=1641972 RepID=A0ABW5AAR5_9RHOB
MSGILTEAGIFVGGGGADRELPQQLLLRYGNRHGLVAGATGTGKTVTLQVLAEGFSAAGVPVFLADVKGDLAGLAKAGSAQGSLHDAFQKRADNIGLDLSYQSYPVTFWDIFGEQGHPVRTTISEMGPLLLSRLLDLTEAQEGVLNIVFHLADAEGLALLDLADLRAMLAHVGARADELELRYGTISSASVGAIQRRLLVLETQGAVSFFGEPALDLADMMQAAPDGRGQINILAADRLMGSPRLYATFLLWLLSELFEQLPEVGDPERPRFVFFFDEAHLLFDDAPKALVDKVEQVARLIRSKGVGIYFVTQSPTDVPEAILGQLGNRVQHALRAFTARDQRNLARAAETYRPNPRFSTETALREVGTGEAVTSFLEAKGVPGMVERTLVRPPQSRLGPLTSEERKELLAASALGRKYDRAIDRSSAAELLAKKAQNAAIEGQEDGPGPASDTGGEREFNRARRYTPGGSAAPGSSLKSPRGGAASRSDSVAEVFGKAMARQIGSKAGQALVRGVLGSLFRSR